MFDQSREVLIAVDLSRSMLAQDVKPSRLDRSKLLITSLLDELKGERVGLVLFAGTAFLQAPLSSDYEVLREFLPALNPDYLPEGGSNYKAMLEASMSAFGTSTADRYLIILSDGESTVDDWKGLTDSLKTKGIRVIGLGVGTAQGSFIPEAGGGLVKDERGAVVMSRLNSSTLQDLAQVTGGAYTDASAWVDLAALLRKTVEAGRKGEFAEKNTARLVERFQWFLAPGLLLLLISFWTEFPVRPRERALPLGRARGQVLAKAAGFAVALLWLSTLSSQLSALAAEGGEDAIAKPLATTVARLATKDAVTAKEYAEMASTTVTYGQRVKSAQQQPLESVVRDALQAVSTGEKLDAKAGDWPKLRAELEELLKKEEPPPQDKKDQDKKDKEKKDQQQDQNQSQDQQQDKDQQQQQSDQQKQDQEQKEQQSQQQKQDAFGDMKDKQDPKPEPKPQPQPGTQKVGGQQEKQPAEPVDAELAMPLQKLEQVRNQDSPAKLQQLMQGPQAKQKPTGKNW